MDASISQGVRRFYSVSDAFSVKRVGIDGRDQNHHRQQRPKQPAAPQPQQGEGDHHKTAQHPQKAAQSVGPGPIFLALQRPRQLDAHGAVLPDLRQVVTKDQKQ